MSLRGVGSFVGNWKEVIAFYSGQGAGLQLVIVPHALGIARRVPLAISKAIGCLIPRASTDAPTYLSHPSRLVLVPNVNQPRLRKRVL